MIFESSNFWVTASANCIGSVVGASAALVGSRWLQGKFLSQQRQLEEEKRKLEERSLLKVRIQKLMTILVSQMDDLYSLRKHFRETLSEGQGPEFTVKAFTMPNPVLPSHIDSELMLPFMESGDLLSIVLLFTKRINGLFSLILSARDQVIQTRNSINPGDSVMYNNFIHFCALPCSQAIENLENQYPENKQRFEELAKRIMKAFPDLGLGFNTVFVEEDENC